MRRWVAGMHVRYMSCISGRKLRDIALYAPRHQQLTCYLCKKYAATMISSMDGPSMSLYHLRVDATPFSTIYILQSLIHNGDLLRPQGIPYSGLWNAPRMFVLQRDRQHTKNSSNFSSTASANLFQTFLAGPLAFKALPRPQFR